MTISGQPFEPQSSVVIPTIESRLFIDCPDALYHVGLTASLGRVLLADEFYGAGVLRANVYVDERRLLSEEARDNNGTEYDADDIRSRHYNVSEKVDEQSVRVIGNMRTIVKRGLEDWLPSEKFFPEAFYDYQAPVGAIEASRFIARHEVRPTQKAVYISLIRSVIAQAHALDNRPVFAVVEGNLCASLQKVGMPIEVMHQAKPIPEYANTLNMLLRFDPRHVLDTVRNDDKNSLPITPFFRSCDSNEGLGYYGSSLLEPVEEQ